MSTPIALLAAVALLAANGFFVAAEFALLASRRSRIEQLAAEGDKRAHHALRGIKELSLMLAGAQLGITVCSLLLGAVAEPAIAHLLEAGLNRVDVPEGVQHAIGYAIGLTIVVFLHMVVGEMAPKSWAIAHPESSALTLARPFRAFSLLFRPVIALLNLMANGLVKLVGVEPQPDLAMAHAPADLLLLLDESAGHGSIAAEEHRLLSRSLELSGLDAGAAMTPRRDIVAVEEWAKAGDVAMLARTSGRSRILVHGGDLDHVVGAVHVKDIILVDPADRAKVTAGELARPVPVTHEHHRLEDLMVEMRAGHQMLTVVVDEHGVVVGIVTLEDVLEELIGDFEDETDRRGRRCRQVGDRVYILEGGLRPDELVEETGVDLPEGDWDTVAGFMIAALDRVPVLGDEVHVDGSTLGVTQVDGYAITEIRLEAAEPPPPADDDEDDG
ncbi:MAG TPA: hemolysin family protein [Iamia sp.]|nr:hemolysin family protein [Iamia sp.]